MMIPPLVFSSSFDALDDHAVLQRSNRRMVPCSLVLSRPEDPELLAEPVQLPERGRRPDPRLGALRGAPKP